MWGAFFVSQKRQVRFCEFFSSSACAFGAASIGCREGKAQLFIRFDVHAAKAGINIRGCAPLSTPGGRLRAVSSGASPAAELPLWSKLRKFLPSVDTERRNGYNTYRVRPKRSAIYEQVFSPIRGITALRTAGRLFLSDSDSYGLNVALKRSKQHHNQFYHTSHLLSDGVLTAVLPYVLYL